MHTSRPPQLGTHKSTLRPLDGALRRRVQHRRRGSRRRHVPLRGCVKAALVLSLLGAACATVGLNGSVGAAPTAPVIDSVPTSPDTSSGNQPVIELMYDQSYPVQVTVVAPGIAVYSGVIDAAQANLNPFLSRTDPAAPTSAPLPPPANSAFVARVSTLLGLIGQTASGASLLRVLGAAHPLPSSADLASASGVSFVG